jgi:hypothetical protein
MRRLTTTLAIALLTAASLGPALAHPGEGSHGPPEGTPPGNPHACVNPAGHERGWCAHERDEAPSLIRGIVTGMNGNLLTLLQGTRPITVDVRSLKGGMPSDLRPGLPLTLRGYFDAGGVFHAISIH